MQKTYNFAEKIMGESVDVVVADKNADIREGLYSNGKDLQCLE